ncbi:MAG: hypothetical protein Q9192_002727 [Flavoplaca navasiana]
MENLIAAMSAFVMRGRCHVMLLKLCVGLEPNLAFGAFAGVTHPVVIGAFLLVLETLVACHTSDVALQVVLPEGLLRSGEVLVLDTYEVFDRVIVEVDGASCLVEEIQVTDMIVSADMSFVVAPMLFEFFQSVKGDSTVGAPGLLVLARNVGCTGSHCVKCLLALVTATTRMSSTDMVLKVFRIGLVILALSAKGVSVFGGSILSTSYLSVEGPLTLFTIAVTVLSVEVVVKTCLIGVVVLALLAIGE